VRAKESFETATKIAYQNGTLRGTPKGQRSDCRELRDAAMLPVGYVQIAKKIADRRMARVLAGESSAAAFGQLSCTPRIKSDTPPSRFTTLRAVLYQ